MRRSVSNLLRFSCRSVPQSYESYTSCIVHSQAPSNRTHPQRQQPSTEQAIETQREQPFEVQLPQCATEHARHAEDKVTRILQSPWPDDLEGRFNSFHIRSAYATGVYWASFVKAKALRKTCFESTSAIAHVAAALPGGRRLRSVF